MTSREDRPLVSIVTPFFNASAFLKETIASVLAQTYSRWEYLLVDDGSIDGSTAIAREYAARYPERIRYFEHEDHQNRGASPSRNVAIANARGSHIAFLDSDDTWVPRKLEEQVAILTAEPDAQVICGASLYWRSWQRASLGEEDTVVPVGAPPDRLFHPPELLRLLYPLGKGAAPCVSSLLIQREVLLQVGGWEESFVGPYQLYEDQVILTKLYLYAPVYVASAWWDRYRQHGSSCMSTVTNAGQYHAVRQRFLDWLEVYLDDKGCEDGEIRRLLDRALRRYRHPLQYDLGASFRRSLRYLRAGTRRLLRQHHKRFPTNDFRGLP